MTGVSPLLGPVICGMEPGGNLIYSEQAVGEVFPRTGHMAATGFLLSLCCSVSCPELHSARVPAVRSCQLGT